VNEAAPQHRGRRGLDAYSMAWDTAQASVLGTAPDATFWVTLEQNGPWGERAATQFHLDPELGRALDRRCQDAGGASS